MTGPLSPPASAASSVDEGELPLLERSAVTFQAVPGQDGSDLGVEDPGRHRVASSDRPGIGRPGSEIGPSPFQISTPERFAAPPRVVSLIESRSTTTRHGPSFFHVPAGPLSKSCTISRPSRKMLKRSGLLSSQT